jgi:hypothetical protein
MRVNHQPSFVLKPVTNPRALADMLGKWVGTPTDMVFSADVSDCAEPISPRSVTWGIQRADTLAAQATQSGTSLLETTREDERNSIDARAPAAIRMLAVPAQKVTFAPEHIPTESHSTPVTLFQNNGAPVGFGMMLNHQEIQTPALLAARTSETFARLSTDRKKLESATELASSVGDFLKHEYPGQTALIDAPIAAFALVNSINQLSGAYKTGDRYAMGHYVLDGFGHSLDLGVDVTTIIEGLAHTATGTGVATLEVIAFGVHILNTAYVLFASSK